MDPKHTETERYEIFFFFFGFWVWKRKVLGLEEKPFAGIGKRRKKEIWVLGLEEEGHGWFGRENVYRNSKRKEEGRKENLVLMPFIWFIKLDKCQNFK